MTGVPSRLIDEVFDQLDNLNYLVRLYYVERRFTIYKSIAVALRLLLTGSSGDQGLIFQVLPDPRLPPLFVNPDPTIAADYLALPGDTVIKQGACEVYLGGGCKVRYLNMAGGAVEFTTIKEILDLSRAIIPLDEWLRQPFLRPEWTLSDFLRIVANKDGGAHLDLSHAKLVALEDWGHFHWHVIAGIARSIQPLLRKQLQNHYPAHTRAVR